MATEIARKFAVLALVSVMAVWAGVACTGGNSVVGTVEDVTPSGIDSFSSLIIKDDDGVLWVFEGGRFPAFTPSHLIEHRIAQERVKVTFSVEAGGRRVVKTITDG